MTKLERPFTEEWDAAGHNVVGIRFDTPIPWPVWDGAGQISDGEPVADQIAEALDRIPEEDRPEFRLGSLVTRAEETRGRIEAVFEEETDPAEVRRRVLDILDDLEDTAKWANMILP